MNLVQICTQNLFFIKSDKLINFKLTAKFVHERVFHAKFYNYFTAEAGFYYFYRIKVVITDLVFL